MIPLEVEEPVSKKAPEWFQHWSDNVFEPRMEKIETRLTNLEKDVSELKKDVALIMRCPTIKKEIAELE